MKTTTVVLFVIMLFLLFEKTVSQVSQVSPSFAILLNSLNSPSFYNSRAIHENLRKIHHNQLSLIAKSRMATNPISNERLFICH